MYSAHAIQQWAVTAKLLGQLGEETKNVVPALAHALKDDSFLVRFYAVWALSQLGQFAATATPALIEALTDQSETVSSAEHLLGDLHNLGEIGALPGVSSALPTGLQSAAVLALLYREMVVHALGEIGPPARAALPALRQLAEEDRPVSLLEVELDSRLRRTAEEAIKKIHRR